MLCKDFFQQRLVAHIALDKLHCLASNFGYAVQAFRVRIADIAAGRKYMKVYRQMKMYNDPATNPVLYKNKE